MYVDLVHVLFILLLMLAATFCIHLVSKSYRYYFWFFGVLTNKLLAALDFISQ